MRPASSAQLFERQPLERGAKRPPTEGARPVQMQPSPSAESLLKGGGFSTLKRSNSEEAAAADLMSSLSGLSRQASREVEAPSNKQPFVLDLSQPPLAAPAIPTIPNFHRVRSTDNGAAMPGVPAIPKIPNFAKALSGSSSSSSPKKPASGSLSARDATGTRIEVDELELRRPLTARDAHSLGVTTPRGTAMKGPMLGDRSTRGMDDLLAQSALITPRPALTPREGCLTPRDGGSTPRSPRTPRGTGVPSARRRGDDCVMAPPPRSPRGATAPGAKRGSAEDGALRRGPPPPPAGGARSAFGGAWLDAAVEAACGESASWLRHATGATVVCTAGAGVETAVDVSDAPAAKAAPAEEAGSGMVVGVIVGEVGGSGGGLWKVRFPHSAAPVAMPADRLHRVPPVKGELACVVVGAGAGRPRVMGVVLSVEGGVAILRTDETGAGAKQVRVMPVDALCRMDEDAP